MDKTKTGKTMTRNEIVARWMGLPLIKQMPEFGTGNWKDVPFQKWRYDTSYDWLMDVWVKFRDLKFNAITHMGIHYNYVHDIGHFILYRSITEAFDELVKGIEWYNSLKQ